MEGYKQEEDGSAKDSGGGEADSGGRVRTDSVGSRGSGENGEGGGGGGDLLYARGTALSQFSLRSVSGGSGAEDEAELLHLLADTHGQYHLVRYARSVFQEENVLFLAATGPEVIAELASGATAASGVRCGRAGLDVAAAVMVRDNGGGEPSSTTFVGQTLAGWLAEVTERFVKQGAEMEINISGTLRSRMLEQMRTFSGKYDLDEAATAAAAAGGNPSAIVLEVKDLLAAARKEVVIMLCSGVDSLFTLYKKTPMYRVSSELRTLQRRQGAQRGKKSPKASNTT